MEKVRLIEVKENILSDNDAVAADLRRTLFASETYVINLMASPGAGKTSLLLQTLPRLSDLFSMGVVEADIDSAVDAEKIMKTGVKSVQLRTGGFCHLDASMVKKGLDAIGYEKFDIVFIENVGNLVCPAEFDTGAIADVMILSVPEGDDKPLKYPLMFSKCSVLIVNKTDMAVLSDFDIKKLEKRVRRLNPGIKIFPLSCRTGEGLGSWTGWLEGAVAEFRKGIST
ncbi:MAG: hydrogenase nickel incorporation protein HypB [Deltaproteobacteria bacterium]|nr:hydrogenase nickel incorporation protein HypB [Deltaproteobacteria bacterium]